jgi:hypothetical protein
MHGYIYAETHRNKFRNSAERSPSCGKPLVVPREIHWNVEDSTYLAGSPLERNRNSRHRRSRSQNVPQPLRILPRPTAHHHRSRPGQVHHTARSLSLRFALFVNRGRKSTAPSPSMKIATETSGAFCNSRADSLSRNEHLFRFRTPDPRASRRAPLKEQRLPTLRIWSRTCCVPSEYLQP